MAPAVPLVYAGQKEAKRFSHKPLNQMMGKERVFSKGDPDGSVLDYHHGEAMAESDGFGSSSGFDTEMTRSADLSQPLRKCNSFNHFGIPSEVISLSKMSKSERKELEMRLKRELDQLRVLQKKVASLAANPLVLSTVTDIRSCSDGKKRPTLESNQVASQHHIQRKQQGPPICNSPRGKAGNAGGSQPPKQAPGSTSNALLMKQCVNLLKQMMSHKYGWVFNAPVDVVGLGIPDYFTVIKHPMDLGTVNGRISSGEYSTPLDFAADVRLTFSNALTYNPAGTDVHFMAKVLSDFFEQRWRTIEKRMRANAGAQSGPQTIDAQTGYQTLNKVPHPTKKKDVSTSNTLREGPVKITMTSEEKVQLSSQLESLLTELPDSIIDFLRENSSTAGQNDEDEMEIDIDALSDETLFKLRKLLDDYLLEKKKNQSKVQPFEMEIHNESRISNSSNQPRKVNDTVDKGADTSARDLPASKVSVMDIEKDASHKNNNSTSSSGGAGSSSTDSSSGDESEHATSVPTGKKLKMMIVEVNLDQNQIKLSDQPVGRDRSQNGTGLHERKSVTKNLTVKVDGDRVGESAPPGMQVSPDKLYRAAMLKNRFADTILKAQEKTLEKRDPEKLRLEREELERRQREERARLLAEAKAAELARKKAQELAAAEAKRKRESEREAARLALQQIEKTVDISDNGKFMEDLELLSSAPPDDLSNFLASGSPNDHDASIFGSFMLRGNSNPLEQLGLYMKVDEEEEEVEAPKSAIVDPVHDVEEGEIDP